MKAVILAGGTGTRLWPMSRGARPKQFFDIVSDELLIREVYHRLEKTFPAEKIYLSISPTLDELTHEYLPEVPAERILIEPEKRDTGPAMGYVAALLELVDPDEPIVFIPSDHFIENEDLFLHCLKVGEDLIRSTGKMIDIGVAPTFPSAVLGYTKIGDEFDDIDGIKVFKFAGHTEKPTVEVAELYIKDGSYLWHANYYMWTPAKFMAAFEQYAPKMGATLRQIQQAVQSGQTEKVAALYQKLEKISMDYAITEKMNPDDVLIIRGDFGWSDIGAWDTLYDRLSKNGENVIKGRCLTVDTKDSLIYGCPEKLIAVLGLKDMVIVDTPDALLVCDRNQAQRIKEIIDKMKNEGHEFYL